MGHGSSQVLAGKTRERGDRMNYIQRFIDDCQARGLTKHTIETYRSNVKIYLRAYSEPDTVDLADLRAFLGVLRAQGLQGSTLKGYFAAISSLYDFLIFEGELRNNPIPPFRKRYLSRLKQQQNGENTRQLISITAGPGIPVRLRSHQPLALVMTLAKTGMRRGENHALKVDDINLKTDTIRIPAKAKRSNRLAFIDPELHSVLEKYLAWRKQYARCDWLWITDSGGRVHKDYPGRIPCTPGRRSRPPQFPRSSMQPAHATLFQAFLHESSPESRYAAAIYQVLER